MELYVNDANRTVVHSLPISPVGGSIEVDVVKDGVTLYSPNQVLYLNNQFSFEFPFHLSQSDNDYEIRWQFNYLENGVTYEYRGVSEVVITTPILPLAEIKAIVGNDWSDWQIAGIEKAVRYIIQSHTGQFFGRYVGTKIVTGEDENFLRLPGRLISFKSVNGNQYMNPNLILRGSGWYLQTRGYNYPPSIRADYDGWHENPWDNQAPITAPYYRRSLLFSANVEYEIDGVWGWNSVPPPVREAAKLLINDYACGDSAYRDRFVEQTAAADWRLQFNEGAFTNTGNVRANQLLAEYVLRRGWSIL